MPIEKQYPIPIEQVSKPYSSNIILSLWNSLNYTLEHFHEIETRGVTWINDYQFIINTKIFSNYMHFTTDTVVNDLRMNGFSVSGQPSEEILNELKISSVKGWIICMKQGFTPNSDEDFYD